MAGNDPVCSGTCGIFTVMLPLVIAPKEGKTTHWLKSSYAAEPDKVTKKNNLLHGEFRDQRTMRFFHSMHLSSNAFAGINYPPILSSLTPVTIITGRYNITTNPDPSRAHQIYSFFCKYLTVYIVHKHLYGVILNVRDACQQFYDWCMGFLPDVKLRVVHAPGMPGTFSGLAIPTCIKTRAWRTCRDACRDH